MKGARRQRGPGTPTGADSLRTGFRVLEPRPVPGAGRDREAGDVRPSALSAQGNRPGECADAGSRAGQPGWQEPAPLPRPARDRPTRAQRRPPSTPPGVLAIAPVGSAQPGAGLTQADMGHLTAVLDHELARNTQTNYRVQWQHFLGWAVGKGLRALPAAPAQVAAYLAERIEHYGHKPATLQVVAAAITFVHKAAGVEDPCASPEVKRTLRSAARKAGRAQKQAAALTAEALAVIQSTACTPRRGRGGRYESPETASGRGNLDIAVISLMRDAMLRVSEAAALTWQDLGTEADGSGRLLIRRSKTDPEGVGVMAFVSAQTMVMLGLIRNGADESERIFGLRPNQLAQRIKQAARAAGLGDGFSGHSPRVGMARDLARAGIELPRLMTAGRWRSPAMPAHYTRNETAGKGAVAQFYGYYRRGA